MKNFEFVIWAHGYFELCPRVALNKKRLYIIKNHLNLVKAVEGNLGPLNQEIYDLISKHLEIDASKQQLSKLKSKLSKKLKDLIHEYRPA